MAPDDIHASTKDSLATVAAIGVLAFVATDLAHEVVGHGIGLLLAGGRAGTLTTTKLIYPAQLPAPSWRIFDLAGPIGNLGWAALCLTLQRLIRRATPGWRLFFWTGAMLGLFWEFGYLMKSGLSGEGDSMALIEGLKPAVVWRALLFLAGLILYRSAIRLLAAELHFVVRTSDAEWRPRLHRLLWTLYFAAGLTACAGAVLDPRGLGEMIRSGAASSFVACVGLGLIPAFFQRHADTRVSKTDFVRWNVPVIGFAVVIFFLFILVLGPGIPISF